VDDAAPDLRPALPWLIGLLILLAAISLGRSAEDEAWTLVGITVAGMVALAVVLVVLLRDRAREARHPDG
jgi:membrane protein DedA with SNARE-associated domain